MPAIPPSVSNDIFATPKPLDVEPLQSPSEWSQTVSRKRRYTREETCMEPDGMDLWKTTFLYNPYLMEKNIQHRQFRPNFRTIGRRWLNGQRLTPHVRVTKDHQVLFSLQTVWNVAVAHWTESPKVKACSVCWHAQCFFPRCASDVGQQITLSRSLALRSPSFRKIASSLISPGEPRRHQKLKWFAATGKSLCNGVVV